MFQNKDLVRPGYERGVLYCHNFGDNMVYSCDLRTRSLNPLHTLTDPIPHFRGFLALPSTSECSDQRWIQSGLMNIVCDHIADNSGVVSWRNGVIGAIFR